MPLRPDLPIEDRARNWWRQHDDCITKALRHILRARTSIVAAPHLPGSMGSLYLTHAIEALDAARQEIEDSRVPFER